MFDKETLSKIKDVVKQYGTTQNSVIENLVRYALEHADFDTFDLAPAKKRGRPAKPKAEVVESERLDDDSVDASSVDDVDTSESEDDEMDVPSEFLTDTGSSDVDTVEVCV